MTDIKAKALALVKEMLRETEGANEPTSIIHGYMRALCCAIEQHEAFKQEVSDAVESALLDAEDGATIRNNLGHFIINADKPDPLVEALTKAGWGMPGINAKELRAALGAVGFEIREKNNDLR